MGCEDAGGIKEELKMLKSQLEVGTRQSWKKLKRGVAVM
jgi:hypothetical protein